MFLTKTRSCVYQVVYAKSCVLNRVRELATYITFLAPSVPACVCIAMCTCLALMYTCKPRVCMYILPVYVNAVLKHLILVFFSMYTPVCFVYRERVRQY